MANLEEVMRGWANAPLNEGWSTLVSGAHEMLASSSAVDRIKAWQQLAMLFGDTRAPRLCLIVATWGIELADAQLEDEPDPRVFGMLRSHAKLAMLDLGLGVATSDGEPIPITEIDSLIKANPGTVEAWMAEFLGSDLDLGTGAQVCANLAAIRAGQFERPPQLTAASVAAARPCQ